MSSISKIMAIGAISLMAFAQTADAQKEKKTHSLLVSKVMDLPAQDVWAVVGVDYGAVANSHPKIVSSNYIAGTLKIEEGAERVCNFNEKGTKYLKEVVQSYDPENMTFINQVTQAGKFPMDPDLTRAVYKVEDLGDGKSRLSFDFIFRTKPAFMGAMAKGKFEKLIQDYFISIEHHIRTGENVNKDNFKEIKKKYKA